MSYITTTDMLLHAKENHYAVAAFNVENMEMMQGVIAAAEKLDAPVILQTTPSTVKYGGMKYFYHNALAAAVDSPIPIALHLDHGNSFELAVQAMRAGYSSIMIDGSSLSLADNIKLTKKVLNVCHPVDIPVEGELGVIGGKEDDLDLAAGDPYTDPDDAFRFAEETGVDSLAVAIGTAHGVYATTPKLDIDRLGVIRSRVSIPLVLHGASGVSDEDVIKCIANGICKVNFATELRIAFSNGVKKAIAENPQAFDPKTYLKAGRESVMRAAIEKMQLCGCVGRGRHIC